MVTLRRAVVDDAETLHRLILALATYEREPDAVEATVSSLAADLASTPAPFECLLAEHENVIVGFALYFQSYSTWRGRAGLFLEDLFVVPEHRGLGTGRALLRALAALAIERGCARLEWAVLDWNTPAIAFYEALGATPMAEWTRFRLSDGALRALAGSSASSLSGQSKV